LKTTVPYVDGVSNAEPATGGADPDSLDDVKDWGPRTLRHGFRAVAAEDFEDLARVAAPIVARARAITPHFDPIGHEEAPSPIADAGTVVVLIVPSGTEPRPTPGLGLLLDVQDYLAARAAPAATLRVTGPDWILVDVTLYVVPVSVDAANGMEGAIQA